MGSIWSQTCSIGRRPPLRGHLKTQAAVVGAGMAGVLTAYALQCGETGYLRNAG